MHCVELPSDVIKSLKCWLEYWNKWFVKDSLRFFFHCNLINKTLLISCRIPINKKIRSKTLDCRTSLDIVTWDPFASDTCFTVKSPTNLTSVLVGNHTEDCKKQGVVEKLWVSYIHWNINNCRGTLSIRLECWRLFI